MWIHDARLARRNAEKGRIKGVDALQKTAITGGQRRRIFRESAACCWHQRYPINALCQQLPILFWIIAASWKATAHPNNRNRFGLLLRDRVQLRLELFNLLNCIFHQGTMIKIRHNLRFLRVD